MDDRTETLETYEPDSYEWDYEEAADRPPRVFWGRIITLGILVVLAFLAGRTTAPKGASAVALEQANERIEELETDLATLEQELEAEAMAAEASEATPTPESETTPAAAGEERTYVVRSGDTLAAIALKFYGDSSLDDFIAEANGIEDPRDLRPGDELIIPPEP